MNDLGYRHLRVVESRRSRVRSVLVIGLAVTGSLAFWAVLIVIVFFLRNPCALCVR